MAVGASPLEDTAAGRAADLLTRLDYHEGMLSLRQLAEALRAQCVCTQEERFSEPVHRVAGVRNADKFAIVFAESEGTLREALLSQAAAVLTTSKLAAGAAAGDKALLLVAQPRLAFAQSAVLLRSEPPAAAVHPTAILGDKVVLGNNVSIGPYAVIGNDVRVGSNTRIDPGCAIAQGVRIGMDCRIYPGVVMYAGVALGDRVTVHAGCVLGSDGFGYVRDAIDGTYTQFPQQGTLNVENDVEIGANTTIDRGALEETRIGRGAKLDNLVHVGHNVRVGRNVVMAAQTGISGSSRIGDGAILGGQVGIGEHAEVGQDVILGGGAGVLSKKKLRGAGVVFWGRPAQPLREYLKGLATLARLTRKAKE